MADTQKPSWLSAINTGALIIIAVLGYFFADGETPNPVPVTPSPAMPVDPDPAPLPPAKIISQIVVDSKGIALDPDSIVCTAIRAVSEQPKDTYAVMTFRVGGKAETVTVTIGGGVSPIPPSPKPEPQPTPKPTTKATAATYVYDVRSNAVPPAVLAGLNRLNREKKILATLYEDDTTNGKSDVPAQYKLACEAAKNAGLPALIVTDGKSVLKVVKDPKTVEQIMESVTE